MMSPTSLLLFSFSASYRNFLHRSAVVFYNLRYLLNSPKALNGRPFPKLSSFFFNWMTFLYYLTLPLYHSAQNVSRFVVGLPVEQGRRCTPHPQPCIGGGCVDPWVLRG
ncbi:hypothetical protein TRVL_00810 [Trypanosoma vivax]|nr:hypothetical protein TRVL_00810 [Trypanosoma vivax]